MSQITASIQAASAVRQNQLSNPLESIGKNASKEHIAQTAKEFESTFISQMLAHMTAGIKTDGPMGGGHAEATWRSMLNEQYAKNMTDNGGIGIAATVERQLLKLQEV